MLQSYDLTVRLDNRGEWKNRNLIVLKVFNMSSSSIESQHNNESIRVNMHKYENTFAYMAAYLCIWTNINW